MIAFDLDGTLVDTAMDLVGAVNALLEERGLSALPFAEARLMIGGGARSLIERGFAAAGEPLGADGAAPLVARFIDLYRDRIADFSRPFEGCVEALDALAAAGATLAVCTNKRTDLSVELLGALGMTRWFAAVIGADLAPAAKPDGRHLATAIAAAGGRMDRALMVGDSAADVGAARAAGAASILVSFGYTVIPAAQLGADHLIDRFQDLPPLAGRLLAASN